ncbi:hypothetical protein GALMADRAFT_250030 [Galerina marginata CBS 339.88]|uniref:BTB domain-containing protein n=1 Tax=Galerina marginata (strain CBS 339.88) TaxID=685588 RepID=A0A067STN1_GALM3|nr:hypothetical protein GALMADRAFT_250030 [Galerina marginata CBS 339.88]
MDPNLVYHTESFYGQPSPHATSDSEYYDYDYDYPLLSPSSYSSESSQSNFPAPSPPVGGDFLTPPPSTSELVDDVRLDTLSISTAFHPTSTPAPDTVFSSVEGVAFYVHAKTILDSCQDAFKPCISAPLSDPQYRLEIIHLDIPSAVLNIILHTLYGTSPAAHSPDLETLVHAVDCMPSFSLSPQAFIRPSSPLYELLLAHAPLHPLEVYALAAHHGLSTLAVNVSCHLLSCDLPAITDEMAVRMGAVFLKKLLQLHAERLASLKAILLQPPPPHPQSDGCQFADQVKLTRAWVLVSAYLAWEARADLSTHAIRATLNPLLRHLSCELCHQTMQDRIKEVVVQWISVKRTI